MTELLSTEDVARIVGLVAYTIRKAIHEGDLRASKVRGQWRIHPDALAEWIDQGQRRQVEMLTARGVAPRPPKPRAGAAPIDGSFLEAARARRSAA